MKHTLNLQNKLILTYITVALLTVLVATLIIRATSGQTLMNLVQEQQTAALKETVQDYYTANGTLDGFFNYYVEFRPAGQPDHSPDQPGKPFENREVRGVFGLVDANKIAVLPVKGIEVGQPVPFELNAQSIPVEVDGKTIAWILQDTSFQFKLSAEEESFLSRTNLAFGLAALAGLLASVSTGIILSGMLLKPIRLLTKASRSLSKGDLEQKVPVTTHDELGQLTFTFNQMSADLAKADQQRKRLTADITHDLSTPLQIISGYVDMLDEGDVTLTPQRLDIIRTEIEHLRRLVGDLTTLSQVEAGGMDMQISPVLVKALMEHVHRAFQPIAAREDIHLVMESVEPDVSINVDEGRMQQVLSNLVENAIRHTPKGGDIHLSVETGNGVTLSVRDTGAGIDPEDLPYVFDRFYKVDKSRGGSSGKMGLGLAICKALVNAQGGDISAESAGQGMGTTMKIWFEALI
jgi:two-component system, OmpR family, sensor histidine kinase BaeS